MFLMAYNDQNLSLKPHMMKQQEWEHSNEISLKKIMMMTMILMKMAEVQSGVVYFPLKVQHEDYKLYH